MAKIVLDTVTGGYDLSVINNNFNKIETEFQNKVLYRDNPAGEANTLQSDMDVNGKAIYNLPEPLLDSQAARLQDVQNALAGGAANLIPFTPYGNLVASNIQAALQEEIDDLGNTTSGAGLIGVDGTTLATFLKERNSKVVDSITALKAVDKTKFTRVFVTGYYTAGDGGGGHYWFDPSDVVSTDNGGTVIVATDGGRWKLVLANTLSVKQFGAKGDGIANDATAIQAAINFVNTLPTGGELHFPYGTYLTGTRLDFPKVADKRLVVSGRGATIQHHGAYVGTLVYFGEETNVTSVPAARVSGMSFVGPYITPATSPLVVLKNSNGTKLEDCHIKGGTTGVELTESYAVSFHNCLFQYQRDFGLRSTTGAMNLLVADCQFLDISTTSTGASVSIAVFTHNITFRDTDFESGYNAVVFTAGGTAVRFDGCYLEGFSQPPVFFGAPSTGVVFESNWIGYNAGTMTFYNLDGCSIRGNVFYNQQSAIDASALNVVIGNNDFRGTSNILRTRYTTPTLINGFSNVGGAWETAGYFKDDADVVHLRGMVTAGADNSCMLLPVGYRPAKQHLFSSLGASRGVASVLVYPDGNVTCFRSADASVDLSNVSFRAQQ